MSHALDYVDESRGIGVGRQEKASGLNGATVGDYAGTLQLLVELVKVLGEASLRRHATRGFKGGEALQLALAPVAKTTFAQQRLAPLAKAELGKSGAREEKAKSEGEKQESCGVCHWLVIQCAAMESKGMGLGAYL